MSRLSKLAVSILFAFILLLSINSVNAASDFDLEKLNFNATLNPDGSMDVVETWQVKINGTTNTLFKSFEVDTSKYSGLANVRVSELINNNEKVFLQSNTWKNHVNTDYFHALMYKGDFEIAWGVNKSSGNHTYIVRYTVNDVVSLYNDCAELYWQFIGTNFEVPINEVNGTIILPNSVEDPDSLRAWGHGPLNGDIRRVGNKTVKFTVSPFIADTFLEIRVAILEPEMFSRTANKLSTNKLNSIINEETSWANKANEQREAIKKREQIVTYGATGISTAIGAIFIGLIVKAIKKFKGLVKVEPNKKMDYFRDIPNENESPAEVAFLYYYNKSSQNVAMPRILSSTILDLSLKKYVTFEVNDTLPKKEQVKIKLINNENAEPLKESERLVLDLFRKIPEDSSVPEFNMKDFEKYAKKHNSSFLNHIDKIQKQAKKEQEEIGHYNKKAEESHNNWSVGGLLLIIILAMVSMFTMGIFEVGIFPLVTLIIPGVIYSVMCFAISGRYNGLTQTGVDEREEWEGLRKYMEEYSMIKDREVLEVALWEKYLVYATLFGNAEKVLKQLKTVYPQFADDEYMRNTAYFYLMTHTNFNDSFVHSVDSAMMKAYQSSVASSSSSSGGGYGGGFSGGGGGRRRWRPEAADAKLKKKREKKS